MHLLPLSFLAGILTVFAPCVFTLLPITLGSTLSGKKSYVRPLIIVGSLALSIFIFTLILKASTALINVPQEFWSTLSGGILIFFGVITIYPELWSKLSYRLRLSSKSDELLQKSSEQTGIFRDILVGFSLGPVFSSCSPTYTVILATVLPQSFAVGVINLIVYVIGLSLVLILIALLGQKFIYRFKWASNPKSTFKKVLGIIFIIIGIAIIAGFDKKVEAYLLEQGFLNITTFEYNILKDVM